MKRILIVIATLALCACIAVVPCFAITTGYYYGETLLHILGAQYHLSLFGTGDDGVALLDTRGLYWYNEAGFDSFFDSRVTSLSYPDCYYNQDVLADADASIVYNDLQFYIDAPTDFPSYNTSIETYMKSDYFKFYSGARLGLHLNPIINTADDSHIVTNGVTVSGTVTFNALNTDGHVIRVPKYRDDLVVGGTYDLMPLLLEFFEGNDIQYYWIEYEGFNVIPTFVQDFELVGNEPFSQVKVIDWATDIVYPEVISYEDFNLLSWLGSAIDGFLTTTIFSVGGIDVTLGVIVSVPLTIMILIVFLKKFAGG